MVAAALPGARVREAAMLPGGLVNTNIAVAIDRPPWQVALRLYQRGPGSAEKEIAIARLLADRVPHTAFLGHGREPTPYAVTTLAEGENLGTLLPLSDDHQQALLGFATGRVLASIHAFRFPHPGFFGADLLLGEPIDFGSNGLLAFLHDRVEAGRAGARLGSPLAVRLMAFARAEAACLDTWPNPACLAHADFNPSNLVMRHDGGVWSVSAVLDWEFALAACPPLDFAILLRPPFDALDAFATGLAEGYRHVGGVLPDAWRHIARVADLFAWADLLSRPSVAPAVVADGRAAVAALVTS